MLGLSVLVFRGDRAKDAELLVLRHENAVLRRNAGPARPHQRIAQRVPDSEHDGDHLTVADLDRERVLRHPVSGGLINEYSRVA